MTQDAHQGGGAAMSTGDRAGEKEPRWLATVAAKYIPMVTGSPTQVFEEDCPVCRGTGAVQEDLNEMVDDDD